VIEALLQDSLAAAGGGEDSAPQQQQQQLFGLLLAFSKAMMRMSELPAAVGVSAEQPAPHSMLSLQAWTGCNALPAVTLVACQVLQYMKQQQQQQAGVISSSMIHWLLLLVRTLYASGTLPTACAAAWRAGEELGTKVNMILLMRNYLQVMHGLSSMVASVLAGFTDVAGLRADPVAADAARQAVLNLQQQVEQQLLPATQITQTTAAAVAALSEDAKYSSNNIACVDLVENVQQLTQQLQQCAFSFCGQLCVTSCCNNPACTNLSRSSEQLLVGGKQCVCSGCIDAHFCSRACLLAMWPHHKQLCKAMKRQRQQLQQQQQQDVQGQQDQLEEQQHE
jgi:hypothetical protein